MTLSLSFLKDVNSIRILIYCLYTPYLLHCLSTPAVCHPYAFSDARHSGFLYYRFFYCISLSIILLLSHSFLPERCDKHLHYAIATFLILIALTTPAPIWTFTTTDHFIPRLYCICRSRLSIGGVRVCRVLCFESSSRITLLFSLFFSYLSYHNISFNICAALNVLQ